MSKFRITKQIHSELERINQKTGVSLNLGDTYLIEEYSNRTFTYAEHLDKLLNLHVGQDLHFCPAIQEPQIRQILVGLQEVLGENPEYASTREKYENLDVCCWERVELLVKSQAEALCQRWLNGLEPMFDREPEKVLEELLEILKKL